MPNPWDVGSARLLAWLGFEALATTSSGLCRHDRPPGRRGDRRTGSGPHGAEIRCRQPTLPVSADLENAFADEPDGVAEIAAGAVAAGLSGFSIEDYTGNPEAPIYPLAQAAERGSPRPLGWPTRARRAWC